MEFSLPQCLTYDINKFRGNSYIPLNKINYTKWRDCNLKGDNIEGFDVIKKMMEEYKLSPLEEIELRSRENTKQGEP